MRAPLLLTLALVIAALSHAQPDPDLRNKYIVVLKPAAERSSFRESLHASVERENSREGASSDGIEHAVHGEYAIGEGFQALTGTFGRRLVARLRADPRVAHVEPDAVFRVLAGSQRDAPWGLARISQREASAGAPYLYPDSAGSGVTVAVIDTGIKVDHPDFEGRARWGFTACEGCPDEDDHGHGTHCAGTVGSKTFGVAKNVSLVAVKAVAGNGAGATSWLLAAINYVAQMALSGSHRGTLIASMSLGGGRSAALDQAVQAAIRAGVHIAVAAGNEAQDACTTSPAAVPEAVTVAASDSSDALAPFSNWGGCVDIVAPGVDIESTSTAGESRKLSGTSMATPHVAGVMALLLADSPGIAPADMEAKLKAMATADKIRMAQPNTPNLLLNNGMDSNKATSWMD